MKDSHLLELASMHFQLSKVYLKAESNFGIDDLPELKGISIMDSGETMLLKFKGPVTTLHTGYIRSHISWLIRESRKLGISSSAEKLCEDRGRKKK